MLWQRGKAYSQDLRERVFAAADEGEPVGQVAAQLRVSASYVSKVLSRRHRSGQATASPQRCHVPPKLAGWHDAIGAHVAAHPSVTLEGLKNWLLTTHKVSVSIGAVWKTLALLKLTLKKSHSGQPSKSVRTSPRRVWRGGRSSQR